MKAIIEIPAGSFYKTELDKATGEFKVDRQLPIACPHNYGFIEGTLAPDGDALDIFIIFDHLKTGDIVEDYEVIGYFACLDGGVRDDKVVGVPVGLRQYDLWSMVMEVGSYLRKYKKGFEVIRWVDDEEAAEKLIVDSKVG